MNTSPQIQQHPASVDAYTRHGWSLVPIPAGTKGPKSAGWNLRENALRSQFELPHGHGVGLAHAYSGTMALDIDNWSIASTILRQSGIDLDQLYGAPDAVIIHSGREGRGKLLYSMPAGLALPSKKIIADGTTVYELRCATSNGLTVQDVLPPSIHPVTNQPYRWAGNGHWTRLPTIPQAILDVWHAMLQRDADRTIKTGGAVNSSWAEIRSAVECVPASCSRDEWVNIGMALHWAGVQTDQLDEALSLWNDWSMSDSVKYPGPREILTQWTSFKTDKVTAVTLGTLFHIAQKHGWKRPAVDVTGLFKAVAPSSVSTPATVTNGIRPPPPDMDLELWPSILRTRAIEVSESVGCDPLVPLFAGLAAACGVIDARCRLELMPGFRVPPVLWLMTLGAPADKKSPGSRPMFAPIKDIEASDRPRFQKELLEWEGKEAAYASAKKAFLDFSASPEAMLGSDQAPKVPELPPQPAMLKITVSDITSQKLVRYAADRPRGLLCYLDEMNSWVKKLTDRSSSEDRSSWVVSYEAERYEMDRVGSGAIHAENLAVSIYGNIQPAIFKANLAALSADGLLQRFIPAILRPDRTKLGNPIPEYLTSAPQWENTLRMIYALPEQVYRLSEAAHSRFRAFQQWYEDAKQDERLLLSGDTFMTAFGKLEGTAGRLILMFHVVENPFSPTVSSDIVDRVIDIIKGYVIPAYRYALSESGDADTFDQWLADHIIHHYDKGQLSLSEIKRSARRVIGDKTVWQQDQMVFTAMSYLESAKWVVRIDDGAREHMHQADWAINPCLGEQFKEHRRKVINARQRLAELRWSCSDKPKPKVKGYEPEE